MVKEIMLNNKRFFACEECGFNYLDRIWSEKCEDWCEEHDSCNEEIIKYSIKNEKSKD